MTERAAAGATAAHEPVVDGRPAGIAADLDDAIAVVGADGTVAWANAACGRLVDRPVSEIIGMDALALIHPDEVLRAIDGIAYAVAFPDRTAVVAYRLQRRDGSWVPVELKSSILSGADGEHLVMVIRDTTTRSTLSSALGSVAAGEDLEITADWIAQAVTSRWPFTAAGVLLLFDEHPVVVARGLAPALVAWLEHPSSMQVLADATSDVAADGRRTEPPWLVALRTGEVTIAELGDLPPELAADAQEAGFTACGAVPVSTPGHGSAVVVAWFEVAQAANLEFAHAMVEMTEILSLAAQRRQHLDQLHAAARRDGLTGLANRVGFLEELADLLAATGPDSCAGLLYVDLDGFKPVNDAHGHAAGDLVLAAIADRLQTFAGDALVARIGGDEFGLGWVVPINGAQEVLGERADRLVEAVAAPLEIADPRAPDARLAVTVSASIGIAITAVRVDPESLLQQADAAMYQAKADGRGRWHLRHDS